MSRLPSTVLGLALCLIAACEAPQTWQRRAIVGGTPTPDGALPAVGALVIDEPMNKSAYCTATLISDRLILTAAHCTKVLPASTPVGFFLGQKVGSNVPVLAISGATAHPQFVGGTPAELLAEYYDIAVLRLAQPVAAAPMKLIRKDEASAIGVGAVVLIAGYGLTSPGSQLSGGTKTQGTTTIGAVGPAEIWIRGDSDPQKCSGDSGGPTIMEVSTAKGSEQRLVGVASRAGESCTSGSVETRVDFYLEWIHSQGTLPCGSGLSPECPAPPDAGREGPPPLDQHPPQERPACDGGARCTPALEGPPAPQPGCGAVPARPASSSAPLLLLAAALVLGGRRRRRADQRSAPTGAAGLPCTRSSASR